MARIGMLLCGCGRYDGTELHEAVLVHLALERARARVEFISPAGIGCEVVDHATGTLTSGPPRDALSESARISRGRITPLLEARVDILDALIVPGGQGVARSFMAGVGEPGRRREADPAVASFLRGFLDRGRPVGAVSLASALVATVLGLPLEENPFATPSSDIVVDEERGIVWTPGFLTSDSVVEVARGIDRMVEAVLARVPKGLTVLE